MKKLLILMLLLIILIIGCVPQTLDNHKIVPLLDNNYDVIVVGGEPEGVAAAVSAARNGLEVLLLEDDNCLGGLMTLGKLNFIDMNYGEDDTLLTRGIFQEFYEGVGGSAFDIEEAKDFFKEIVEKESSLVYKINTLVLEPIKEGNNLVGVKVLEDGNTKDYYAQRLIDATTDADLAAAAGVPYTIAGEDIGEKNRLMGVTLIFELKNVSWPKVFLYLNWNRLMGKIFKDERQHMGAKLKTAWGYTEEGFSYEPQDALMRLRGFNIARQKNGNVLINALLIFGVDVLDEASKQDGKARAKKELEYMLPYIRENFTGFTRAELVRTAEQLYVRESRHIIGEYQLSIDDVLENRDQWDRIAIASYPVDVQPTIEQRWGTIVGNPDRYSIPFRSLVPKEIDNLLVVGRSASYKSLAAGSARVIPVGMCEGEAAGVAAAYSVENNITFRDMTKSKEAIKWIQEKLILQGAYLEPFEIKAPITEHWAYKGVKVIRSLGLLDGGYDNNYHLDEKISKWRFQNMLNNLLKKTGFPIQNYIEVSTVPTNEEILKAVVCGVGEQAETADEARKILKNKGILTAELHTFFGEDKKQPNAAEVIMLLSNMYEYGK